MQIDDLSIEKAIAVLQKNGVVVMPSDTIYGIFGRADSPEVVKRIRKIKGRGSDQAFIVLCSEVEEITDNFGVDEKLLKHVAHHWPGPVSIILEPGKPRPDIQGDLAGIAFRIPNDAELLNILKQTGPLVAPSANPKGQDPAKKITAAQTYFGDTVDLYVNGGIIENSKPSKVIKINPDGSQQTLRN